MKAIRRSSVGFGIVLGALALLPFFGGCERKQNAPSQAANRSSINAVASGDSVTITTSKAQFVLSREGSLRASLQSASGPVSLDKTGSATGPEIAVKGASSTPKAEFDLSTTQIEESTGKLGLGKTVRISGKALGSGLSETLTLESFDAFPEICLASLTVRNGDQQDVTIDSISFQKHEFTNILSDQKQALWTFAGSSLHWGKDEIFPLPAKYEQTNPFGLPVATKDDLGYVGGGVPVVAFWNGAVGEALGHVETLPLAVSLPVRTVDDGRSVDASMLLEPHSTLKPGETYTTPRSFIAVFHGDFYEPLQIWSNFLDKEGLSKPANNEENYAVSWCGWGYEFAVTPKQMLDTVPKLKELGIHWATLDDGWFNDYGDWQPNPKNFPGQSVQDMVRSFHQQDIKVQLWWLPLAAEDGKHGYGGRQYIVSDVVKQHPEWLVLDRDGKPARMARNLAVLCPALPAVQNYYRDLTTRFIKDWGFDGHKLDNIYTTPMCFNPAHHHKSPMESVYGMADVYRVIFETTRALKPDSVTQSCPCGTPPSLAWLRYMDQAVTADPVGSVQVRRRIKMYKALLGANAAVYGDHVELTRISGASTENEQDTGDDFASTLGVGGVLGTKFTWPDYGPKFKNVYLTPQKENHWHEWIDLYNQKMLSKGEFLNLYVYGFDFPEAYAIRKDGHMYYSFFVPSYVAEHVGKVTQKPASQEWSGSVELRGLTPGQAYHVSDYVHHQDLGTVTGGKNAKLNVKFSDYLLIEAVPASSSAAR